MLHYIILSIFYKTSKLGKLITGNLSLGNAFEEFCSDTHTANSFFNKKYYLAGLKDGIDLFTFLNKKWIEANQPTLNRWPTVLRISARRNC